jgi:Fe2+ or Zn2+ uptake regulation protein
MCKGNNSNENDLLKCAECNNTNPVELIVVIYLDIISLLQKQLGRTMTHHSLNIHLQSEILIVNSHRL